MNYKMFDVITIGSSTRDVLIKSDDFKVIEDKTSETGLDECLPLGAKIEIKEIVFTTGGGGSNTAVTFARQDFNTACVGVVGVGINGQEVLNDLIEEGVETKFFQKRSDDRTAYSVILVHSSGERTILSYKGEGQHFEVAKIPFEELQSKWFYIASIGGHYDLLEAVVNHAVKNNIKIAINPGVKEIAHGLEKLKPILEHVDIYITNKEEGEELVGNGEWNEVLKKLKAHISGIVTVSDGHNGVRVVDMDGNHYEAGVPDSPVVERTGAGDAFGSGFVCEYIRSTSTGSAQAIEKAIQFATANASSVVMRFGAKAGILKKDDWGSWPLVEVTKK